MATTATPTLPASRPSPAHWTLCLPGGRRLDLAPGPLGTKVMGIVNLTPDSFSDGGRFASPDEAVEHGLALLAAGADLLDLGAESTRPGGGVYGGGARRVEAEEELARLLPVLTALRRETAAPLSVDTRKGAVARAALAAGADLINDVSNLADPDLGRAAAAAGCPLLLMHSRGEIGTMQAEIRFADLLGEVRAELAAAAARATVLGVEAAQILLDPGIGFGKTADQNLRLLSRLDAFAPLGRPLVVGASRKSFLGRFGGAPPERRLGGSLAAVAVAAVHGAALVRVHDVFETVQFLAAWRALEAAE